MTVALSPSAVLPEQGLLASRTGGRRSHAATRGGAGPQPGPFGDAHLRPRDSLPPLVSSYTCREGSRTYVQVGLRTSESTVCTGPEMSFHICGQDYWGRRGFLTFIRSFIHSIATNSLRAPATCRALRWGLGLGAGDTARGRAAEPPLSCSPILLGERRSTHETSSKRKLSNR